jgi:hypothetical protein
LPGITTKTIVDFWIEFYRQGEGKYGITGKLSGTAQLMKIYDFNGTDYFLVNHRSTPSTDVNWYKEKLKDGESVVVTVAFGGDTGKKRPGCCWYAGQQLVGLAM